MQEYTSKSMIDLSLNVDRNMFRDVRAVPSLSMDSMHRMVIATLKWSKEKPTRKQCKTRLNVEKLKDASCAQDMRIKILRRLGESQADDLEGEWSRYKVLSLQQQIVIISNWYMHIGVQRAYVCFKMTDFYK